MNHTAIIKRAIEITRRYRALWVFGILVALTGGGSSGFSSNWSSDGNDMQRMPGDMGQSFTWPEELPGQDFIDALTRDLSGRGWHFDPNPAMIGGGIALLCGGILLLVLLSVIVNYVGRSALIRMVDHVEETGYGLGVSQGFELGWSFRTLRLFLLDILLMLLALLIMIPILLLAIVPVFLMLSSEGTTVLGVLLGVAIAMLGIPLFIVVAVGWRIASQMWSRELLVGGVDIGSALSGAVGLLKRKPLPLGLMWLIMLVIYIFFGLAMIPVFLLVALVAAAAAIGVGAAIYSLAGSAIGAVVVGLPIFLILMIIPLLFVLGLYKVFESSVWTLAWRELTGRDSAGPEELGAYAPLDSGLTSPA